MAEIIVDCRKCVGCEDCVFLCPVGVFQMEEGKAVPFDGKSCCGATCRICVQYCWREAIRQES